MWIIRFVNLIHIDIEGYPWQLNARMPQGLELERGDSETLGLRVGTRHRGLGVPGPHQDGRATLVILATSHPLELGHLVQTPAHTSPDTYSMQGLSTPVSGLREGGRAPHLLMHWACQFIEFDLRTRPPTRPSSRTPS